MTIPELFDKGFRRIRQEPWNKYAYVMLYEKEDGTLREDCKLWDIGHDGDIDLFWRVLNHDKWFPWYKPENADPDIYKQQPIVTK